MRSDSFSRRFRRHLKHRHPSRQPNRRALLAGIEHLESRRLLATGTIAFDEVTGEVLVTGTEGNDRLDVWKSNGIVNLRIRTDRDYAGTWFHPYEIQRITFDAGPGDDVYYNQTSVISTAVGGPGNDSLRGGSSDDLIFGNEGHDTLRGWDGNDELHGGSQVDRLYGDAGNDRLFGGGGSDSIWGSSGDDLLVGGLGSDYLHGGDDHDELHGDGFGQQWGVSHARRPVDRYNDRLYGGNGNDVAFAGPGSDLVYGQNGNDVLYGGLGEDDVRGGNGDDIARGGPGRDYVRGENDNDVVMGDADEDTVRGGIGRDIMVGGTEVDTVLGDQSDDLIIGGSTHYDDDVLALRVILSTWAADSPYANRVGQLQDHNFPHPLLPGVTVHDDFVIDQVWGNHNQDWFILPAGHSDDPEHHDLGGGHGHSENACDAIATMDRLRDRDDTERVSSNAPHPTAPVLRTEHCALFALVDLDDVSHTVVASGPWSALTTWADVTGDGIGDVPTPAARVLVPEGLRVTIDGIIAEPVKTVRVMGTLEFDPTRNTELRVDTVIVDPGGSYIMGTEEHPVLANNTARLVIADFGAIDREWDPFEFSRGLIIHGTGSFHGAEKSAFHGVREVTTDHSGEQSLSTIELDEVPTNWKPGDNVAISGANWRRAEHEVRKILAINGSTITVFAFDREHQGLDDQHQIHVANLTRNVQVVSQNPENEHRGHMMAMHTRHIDINYAAFESLGRTDKKIPVNDSQVDEEGNLIPGTGTNQRGRYAVHFHRNGVENDGNPATVNGAVVVDSLGLGYVVHGSYVTVDNSIAFDTDGAGFFTEDGSEIGHFRKNIAIFAEGSGESITSRSALQDFAHEGDGFWMQGGGFKVEENVATGMRGHGFVFFTSGLVQEGLGRTRFPVENLPDPSIADGQTSLHVEHVPLFSFRDNESYGNRIGAQTQFHLRTATHSAQSRIEGLTLWNNLTGLHIPYTKQTVVSNVEIIGDVDNPRGTGVNRNSVTGSIRYEDVIVEGYYYGIRTPVRGQNVIDGGYFNNIENIEIRTAIEKDRSVLVTGDIQFGTLSDDALRGRTQYMVRMRADLRPMHESINHLFYTDTVMLNYGPFVNKQLYFNEQRSNYVPFEQTGEFVPEEYVGMTNEQLMEKFGKPLGGKVAPGSALVVEGIFGLVDP